jgi:hypothetical protein
MTTKLEDYIRSDRYWWSESNERSITVEEEERSWSGLYDKDGNKLYKQKKRIGYV